MESVSRFITRKLKLKVNQSKSKVDRPWRCKFLGFRIVVGKETKRYIALESLWRFKRQVRELTRYGQGVTVERMIEKLNCYLIKLCRKTHKLACGMNGSPESRGF